MGHRQRLKKRYLQGGYEAFHEYEVIELLLTYTIPRKDVKPLAKSLIEKFRSIEGVLNASKNSLLEIDGLGESSIVFFKLLGDIYKNLYKKNLKTKDVLEITNKKELLNYLKSDIGFSEIEEFKLLFLDNSNKLINTETLFYGTIDKSAIYPREIIKKVIEYRAKGVIFAHNHPSGKLRPSKADIEVTKHMEETLQLIDVVLLEHIIVTRDGYFSFLEEGLI